MPPRSRSKATTRRTGDWAARIVNLRDRLKLSQSELGKRLNSSAMAVSRWERGVQEPPANVYILLGNLTGDPDCWYFWGRAGLHNDDLMRVLPSLRTRLKRERLPEVRIVDATPLRSDCQENELLVIPLLSDSAAAGPGSIQGRSRESRTEAVFALPHEWSPHPGHISAFRVKGNSMAPLINDSYIVAVDTAQCEAHKLCGEIVAAWHRDQGLIISRLQCIDATELLVPDNRQYKPIAICLPEWRIVGKVIWWMCAPPISGHSAKHS